MKIEDFDKLLKGNNGIAVTDDLVIYNDYELYNYRTEIEKHYKNLIELVEANPEIKKIILETETFYNHLDGGNGASSGKMGGGFTSAGGNAKGNDEKLLPASMNVGTGGKHNIESAIDRFRKKYSKSDVEYGVAVDDRGYAHEHIKGGNVSVGVIGGKGLTIIHNHPSGGNFSKADLQVLARTNNKGIVATSSNASKKSTYHIEKTNHFKAKEFDKAINKAKWPSNYSYSKGADWWLKKNAQKYGYKYTSSGVPKK